MDKLLTDARPQIWHLGLGCWLYFSIPFSPMWGATPSQTFFSPDAEMIAGLIAFALGFAIAAFAAKLVYPLHAHLRAIWVMGIVVAASILVLPFLEGTAGAGACAIAVAAAKGFLGAVTMLAWVEFFGALDLYEIGRTIAVTLMFYALMAVGSRLFLGTDFSTLPYALLFATLVLGCVACLSASWRRFPDASHPDVPALHPSVKRMVEMMLVNLAYGSLFCLMYLSVRYTGNDIQVAPGFLIAGLTLIGIIAVLVHRTSSPQLMRTVLVPTIPCCLTAVLVGEAVPWLASLCIFMSLAFQAFFVIAVFTDVTLRYPGNPLVTGGECGAFFAVGMGIGAALGSVPGMDAVLAPTQAGFGPISAVVLAATLMVALIFLPNGRGELTPWGFSLLLKPDAQQEPLKHGCDVVAQKYGLTNRELDVLRLLAKGRDQEHIERVLVISANTAKTHIYHIFNKTEVHSRQELIDLVEASDKQ